MIAALLFGWYFVVYPIDAIVNLSLHSRVQGPYPTLRACLEDAVDIELRSRGRLMTTICEWQ